MPCRYQLTSSLGPCLALPSLAHSTLNPSLASPPGASRPSSPLPHACQPYSPQSEFFVVFKNGGPKPSTWHSLLPSGLQEYLLVHCYKFGEAWKLRQDSCLSDPPPPSTKPNRLHINQVFAIYECPRREGNPYSAGPVLLSRLKIAATLSKWKRGCLSFRFSQTNGRRRLLPCLPPSSSPARLGRTPLTGLSRIMVTRFFCSIRLKSCRRFAARLRRRRYSGSSSEKRSTYCCPCGGGGEAASGTVSSLIVLVGLQSAPGSLRRRQEGAPVPVQFPPAEGLDLRDSRSPRLFPGGCERSSGGGQGADGCWSIGGANTPSDLVKMGHRHAGPLPLLGLPLRKQDTHTFWIISVLHTYVV